MSEESQDLDKQIREYNKERIQELEDNYSEDSLIYREVRPQLEEKQ